MVVSHQPPTPISLPIIAICIYILLISYSVCVVTAVLQVDLELISVVDVRNLLYLCPSITNQSTYPADTLCRQHSLLAREPTCLFLKNTIGLPALT